MAVGISADELKRSVWEDLRDHFLAQAGDVDLDVDKDLKPTRLAFLDTGPTNDSDPENGWDDNSPHGYTLVNMAKDLLCDSSGGGCVARITSRLALPRKDSRPVRRPPIRGGYIGTLSDLAVAIRREVSAWERTGRGDRLILNLSLGWDGELFGGHEGTVQGMPLDVQAVYRAIQDAVCRGALVVAAAGNVAGGPGREAGPLHPAAWETRRAPGNGTCAGTPDKEADALLPGPGPYRPLVYAVGGVGAGGDALANARPRGEPRLTAFADHAVVDDGRGAPTAVLTGSSVSAAVVSAAAAAVWYYLPDKEPHEVLEIVYQAGADLERTAGFCLDGTPGDICPGAFTVRRASVCEAVYEALTQACEGGVCEVPEWECASAGALQLSRADLNGYFKPRPHRVDLDRKRRSDEVPGCGAETLHFSRAPQDPCPHRQYHGLAAKVWSGPQPPSDPCPSCWIDIESSSGDPLTAASTSLMAASTSLTAASTSLTTANLTAASTATLYIEIDSKFDGTLTAPTLIMDSKTTDSNTYSLTPPLELKPGDRVVVHNVPVPANTETDVSISFTLDDEYSVTSPVLVIWN